MDCKEYNKIMGNNKQGDLSPQVVKLFKDHSATCPECKNDYEAYELTTQLFETLEEVNCPISLKAKINQELDKTVGSIFDVFFGRGHNPIKAGLAVGAALFVMVVLSTNVISITDKKIVGNKEAYYVSNANPIYVSQFYTGSPKK